MPKVSIVIPNLNGADHLPGCLASLRVQTFREFEIVVVDNGSTDTPLGLLGSHPEVEVIELGRNAGFPGSCNAGIRGRDSTYVVLLNNDTAAAPDWLERLVAAMDAEDGFAWGSSKLVGFDDPDTVDSAGHTYSLWVGAAHNVGQGLPAASFLTRRRVFGAAAAASIYRRSLFEDIGLLDEEFFLIHEDTEFDVRANAAGYRCLFVPDAVVRHKRGVSYDISPALHLTGVRNRIWATRAMPLPVIVLWVVTKFLRAFRWIPARLTGRTTSPRTSPSAWRDVSPLAVVKATLGAFVSLRRKRREVRHVRRTGSLQFLRILSETAVVARSEARSNQ